MKKGIKQINHYKLYKELGKGPIKTVYLAIDERNDNLLIVKAFNNYKDIPQNLVETRECIKCSQRSHENILKLIGKEKTSNNLYFCYEYMNGGNLAELLPDYQEKFNIPMSEREVQLIMRQLIEGFEYLENNKVSKRDIGLRDVLINYSSLNKKNQETSSVDKVYLFKTNRYNIKIDFITAILETNATRCGMAIETLNQETNKLNHRSRPALWSLGAIAFELLFGVSYSKSDSSKTYNIAISSEATAFIKTLLKTINHTQLSWKNIKELPFISNQSNTFHMKYYMNSLLDSINSPDSMNSEYYSFINLEINTKPIDGNNKQFEVVIGQKGLETFGDINLDKDKNKEDSEDKWEVISVHSDKELNDIENINIVNNSLNV